MIDVVKASVLLQDLALIDHEIMVAKGLKPLAIRQNVNNPEGYQKEKEAERARLVASGLKVKRNYTVDKGHDLDGSGKRMGYDLTETGEIELVVDKPDRTGSTVRVVFDESRSHLWFNPDDLDLVT